MFGMNTLLQIRANISNYINGMQKLDIEEKLYELYKTSAFSKDGYIKFLNDILELKIEEHIRNVIEKLENE